MSDDNGTDLGPRTILVLALKVAAVAVLVGLAARAAGC